jgi:hypothetical protein
LFTSFTWGRWDVGLKLFRQFISVYFDSVSDQVRLRRGRGGWNNIGRFLGAELNLVELNQSPGVSSINVNFDYSFLSLGVEHNLIELNHSPRVGSININFK